MSRGEIYLLIDLIKPILHTPKELTIFRKKKQIKLFDPFLEVQDKGNSQLNCYSINVCNIFAKKNIL